MVKLHIDCVAWHYIARECVFPCQPGKGSLGVSSWWSSTGTNYKFLIQSSDNFMNYHACKIARCFAVCSRRWSWEQKNEGERVRLPWWRSNWWKINKNVTNGFIVITQWSQPEIDGRSLNWMLRYFQKSEGIPEERWNVCVVFSDSSHNIYFNSWVIFWTIHNTNTIPTIICTR